MALPTVIRFGLRRGLGLGVWALCVVGILGCRPLVNQVVNLGSDIHINSSQQYQTIEGFGTCLVHWVPELAALYQTESFQDFYVNELGASMLRIELWPDVSRTEIANWQDIRYQDFDFTDKGRNGQVFVDFIEAIHDRGPDGVKLIATVWSPPGWMKINGQTTSGDPNRENFNLKAHGDLPVVADNRLRPDRYQHFAKWLVEWVKFFEAKGIPLYALSPQNEPVFSMFFNSAVYSPPEYSRLIQVIGEMFEQEGIPQPLLFGPEHLTRDVAWTKLYLDNIQASPAAKYFNIVASHGYVDGVAMDKDPSSPGRFWQLVEPYGYRYWMTEAGTGDHTWPDPLNGIGAQLHASLVEGQASAFLPWQVAGKKVTYHNLMLMDQPTAKTYVTMQYWRFIRPGAVRIEASSQGHQVESSAFVDEERQTLTVVLLNRADTDREMTLNFQTEWPLDPTLTAIRTSQAERLKPLPDLVLDEAEHSVTLAVPAQSITTVVGSWGT